MNRVMGLAAACALALGGMGAARRWYFCCAESPARTTSSHQNALSRLLNDLWVYCGTKSAGHS
jgi:hypothetical protein